MDSVDSKHPKCWLCGGNGMSDSLDVHHIFSCAYRAKSEKFGLTVLLCHNRCRINGFSAAHRSPDTARRLHEYGQRKAMKEQGWTVAEFRRQFGKNYLDED